MDDTHAPRVLVVGTGFGCRVQIPALRAAGFDTVGLVGADPTRTAERASANGIPQAFTDLDKAITTTGAVAVAIATTPDTHRTLTLTALSHGCHVLCEKPFALDADEARTMLDAAERAGVVHLVGHEFRFTPELAMVARLIAEGHIGDPRQASFVQSYEYLRSSSTAMPEWWWDPEAGGGWLAASGSHTLDTVRTWLGDIVSVSAALTTNSSRPILVEDSFTALLRLANGGDAAMQQSGATWGPPAGQTRVAGTDATVWVEDHAVHIADRAGHRVVPIATDLLLPPMPPVGTDPRQQTPEWQYLVSEELPQYTRLCQAWRRQIQGEDDTGDPRAATFADGLAIMQALDAMRQSAAKGGELITLP